MPELFWPQPNTSGIGVYAAVAGGGKKRRWRTTNEKTGSVTKIGLSATGVFSDTEYNEARLWRPI
jgi:hypothetical protein